MQIKDSQTLKSKKNIFIITFSTQTIYP